MAGFCTLLPPASLLMALSPIESLNVVFVFVFSVVTVTIESARGTVSEKLRVRGEGEGSVVFPPEAPSRRSSG
jgi:hypothetical protein